MKPSVVVCAVAGLVWMVGRADAQVLGDANCDGRVDDGDVAAVASALFDDGGGACAASDVNLDWIVSAGDAVAAIREQARTTAGAPGPVVSYFGLAGPDGSVQTPIGEAQGIPVYYRQTGFGFRIVIEGNPGPGDIRPGTGVLPSGQGAQALRPDVQLVSNRRLGDGSAAVCDGGVPAIDPPRFDPGQMVTDVLNDMACNAVSATAASFACTQDAFGSQTFVTSRPFVQFCVPVSRERDFASGETVLTVRLRDVIGQLGPERRLIVRVGSGPPPPTFTLTPTRAPASPSPTRTQTPTQTVPATATLSPRPTSTATATEPPTPTRTATILSAASSTPTRAQPTVTPGTPVPTATGPTRTATRTLSPTASTTPTTTATRSVTPTRSATTVPASRGPVVTFFGLTRADDSPIAPTSTEPDGTRVFQMVRGLSFGVVVEAKRGASGVDVGCLAYRDPLSNPPNCSYPEDSVLPDLQIVSSQPLGDGSEAVCDSVGAFAGGVPAVEPPRFDDEHAAAINDFGCRFVDGSGQPLSRASNEGCVKVPPTDDFGFAAADSWLQFCSVKINRSIEFPAGDTVLTARLRDKEGNVGLPARIIVRVGP